MESSFCASVRPDCAERVEAQIVRMTSAPAAERIRAIVSMGGDGWEKRLIACPTPPSTREFQRRSRSPRTLPGKLRIRLGCEQRLGLARVVELHPDHPAGTVGIAVYQRGLLVEPVVYLDDFAGDGTEQPRHGFDRLDRSEHVVPGELRADFRQLHIDNVAQLALREISDADFDRSGRGR